MTEPRRPRDNYRTYPYGVYYRRRRKPWIVKFYRAKRTIYVGSFQSYLAAVQAANDYLRTESQ